MAGDGEFISGGNNLIGNGDDVTGFVDGVNGDLVGSDGDDPFDPQNDLLIDPKLRELQNNGGATETFALLEESPAIDAGSNPNNLETDQRGEGFNRTVGNGTDIGAYEVQTIINDEIIGTENNDRLRGTSADDTIRGLDGNDFIHGFKGDDAIYGDAGNERIFGNRGDDLLDGGDGDDRIFGGAGNDIFLAFNGGDDLFRGGSGSDVYIYNLNADAGFDRDLVRDFRQREDKIAFRLVDGYEFDSFDDLDTNGSGTLDSHDERVIILGHSTVIDFSDVFGRDSGSDTITLRANNLNSDNFIFDEAILATEFG